MPRVDSIDRVCRDLLMSLKSLRLAEEGLQKFRSLCVDPEQCLELDDAINQIETMEDRLVSYIDAGLEKWRRSVDQATLAFAKAEPTYGELRQYARWTNSEPASAGTERVLVGA